LICAECAWESDGVKHGSFTRRGVKIANRVIRKNDGQPIGHAGCKGLCPCRHRKVKPQ
jgi:hypothetical protein